MSKEIRSVAELFAAGHGTRCSGPDECHWCGSPCERDFQHDEPEVARFVKRVSFALRPVNGYICLGCWIYRRKHVTVQFLGGGYKDRQSAANHSWFVTPTGATMIRPVDLPLVYKILLQPPLIFSLSLVDVGTVNHVQFAVLNNHQELRADTKLYFTINNVKHCYTVYELEQGIRKGPEGLEPGVGAALRYLGPPPADTLPKQEEKKPKVGRPPAEKASESRLEVRRVIKKN